MNYLNYMKKNKIVIRGMEMKIIKKIKQRFCKHNGEYTGYRKGNRYICVCEKCGKTIIDFTIIREKNNGGDK